MIDNTDQFSQFPEELTEQLDEFIDGLVEEGFDFEEIEAVLTDEDFLAQLKSLDDELMADDEGTGDEGNDEPEQIDELSKKTLKSYSTKKLSKEETAYRLNEIRKGRCEWGTASPTIANAVFNAILTSPDEERDDIIESAYTDQEFFQYLVTADR